MLFNLRASEQQRGSEREKENEGKSETVSAEQDFFRHLEVALASKHI